MLTLRPSFLYLLMGLSSLITALLGLYALLRKRGVPQALPFAFIALTATAWTAGNALRIASPSLADKILWQRLIYLGNSTVPVAYLCFSLRHAGLTRWLTRRAVALYLIPALLTILAVFSNDFHHLVWQRQWLGRDLLSTPGPLYWFHFTYSYLYVLITFLVLIQAYRRATPLYRKQAALLAAGAGIPIVVSLITDVLGWDLIQAFDEPTASVLFSSLVLAWGIFRYKALDIVPIAHSLVIQSLEDAIFVLDLQDRVVYLNPASMRLLGSSEARAVGQPFALVLSRWSESAVQAWQAAAAQVQVPGPPGSPACHYELRRSPLFDHRSRPLGGVVIFHDISERIRFEQQLRRLAVTDHLTGCYNRRQFMDLAALEVERALRYARPLSVLILDIDHFKRVNDGYGHAAGDQVLKQLVSLCQQCTRQTDLFARYGGEEFVFLLSETGCEQARQAAERLREAIQGASFETTAGALQVTASLGLASLPADGVNHIDGLLARADEALYASKQAGRNRVYTWSAL